jgi:transcriptional regulator with XRE-family HTH domain
MGTRPLSELLRELREERGSSLRGAAKDLGVDPSYLSRLERGEKPASPQLLRRAAEYYEVPEEDLALAEGKLPADVVDILVTHPDLIERIRSEYGSQ